MYFAFICTDKPDGQPIRKEAFLDCRLGDPRVLWIHNANPICPGGTDHCDEVNGLPGLSLGIMPGGGMGLSTGKGRRLVGQEYDQELNVCLDCVD